MARNNSPCTLHILYEMLLNHDYCVLTFTRRAGTIYIQSNIICLTLTTSGRYALALVNSNTLYVRVAKKYARRCARDGQLKLDACT